MRVPVKSAILHGPLFLHGTNLGEKIPADKPCTIVYDNTTRMLEVTFRNITAWISVDGGVASFIPMTVSKEVAKEPVPASPPRQMDSPTIQTIHPMASAAPTPRDPAQVEIPMQPKQGRTKAA